jgi:hypothetical protein
VNEDGARAYGFSAAGRRPQNLLAALTHDP